MRDYIELTKPRITWLILMSTGIGYFFGLPGAPNWLGFLQTIHFWPLVHTIVGTGLIASGTAALNQWYEREADRHMRRTSARPLPSGRISRAAALAFGAALSVAGFVELWLGVNLLAASIGAFTLASYLFLYTPLKQRTWWSTTIGAIPGAMPPMIGYAAAAGAITRESWVLFAILFLWQFPHFYSIAWMYKEDYARAGIRMLPGGRAGLPLHRAADRALRPGAHPRQPGSGYAGNVGPHLSGRSFAAGPCGSCIRACAWRWSARLARARGVLLTSVLYLPLIYGLMLLDRPGL